MASNNATPSVGVFVGENQNWTFFHDLFKDFQAHYNVPVYRPKTYNTPLLHGRLNRWALNHQITSILKSSDVAFFEWASDLLEIATHMPKYCPIVTRLHSFELHAWGGRINWDHVDRVVFVSEAMRRNFIELYPSHAGKTAEVYNGIRLDKFQPHTRKGGLNLGMLCSLLPRKRVYEAILSFAKLREQGVDATLHIAGGRIHGPGHDEYYVVCHKVVEDLGLTEVVKFYEHIEGTADFLSNMDVFISHSFWEGQQVALLEAMASGCYCLSHRWMGVEEVLPEDNLYLMEDELIAKIAAYAAMSSTERQERQALMSQMARAKFGVDRQKDEMRAVLQGILTARPMASNGAMSVARP